MQLLIQLGACIKYFGGGAMTPDPAWKTMYGITV